MWTCICIYLYFFVSDDLNEVKENGTNNCDSVQEDNPFSFQKFKPKSDEPLKPKNKKLLVSYFKKEFLI